MLLSSPTYANPLPPEQAFSFSARLDQPDQITLQWQMAPSYYLYRDKFYFTITPAAQTKIGHVVLPPRATYKDSLKITLPLLVPAHLNTSTLTVHYQGCSSHGFCYSPIEKKILLDNKNQSIKILDNNNNNNKNIIEQIFAQHSIFIIILSFLGLGLLLAFTPCVLPMVPILSGIIIGHRKKSPAIKTFGLSLAYVLGMAVMYAIAGMVVALIGSRIQIELQRPWIIVLFSGIFVLLALSLFGLYEFRLPSRWQNRLTRLSNHQRSGTYLGVFLMGGVSSLIVSPCISPALVGVLAYIAHSGDVGLGAVSLLALGIGMGLPLLFIGASMSKLLPKAGAWMQTIEHVVGIIMLGFSIWLLAKILPGSVILFLWSLLLILSAIKMGQLSKLIYEWRQCQRHWIRYAISGIALIYGIILMIGGLLGNTDPLYPLENVAITKNKLSDFIILKNNTQLNQLLEQAIREKKWVILDFSASWCASCVKMDRDVFTQPVIKQSLADFLWLRADITENNLFDKSILQRFHIIAPPVLLFFAPNGNELVEERMVGEINSSELLLQLQKFNLIKLKKTKDNTRVN